MVALEPPVPGVATICGAAKCDHLRPPFSAEQLPARLSSHRATINVMRKLSTDRPLESIAAPHGRPAERLVGRTGRTVPLVGLACAALSGLAVVGLYGTSRAPVASLVDPLPPVNTTLPVVDPRPIPGPVPQAGGELPTQVELEAMDERIRLSPGDPDQYIARGRAYYRLRRFEDAVADFEQAIARNPSSAEAYQGLGLAEGKNEHLPEAERAFSQAIAFSPGMAAAHNGLGVIYLRQGRREDARAAFERALAIDPTYATARANLESASAPPEADAATAVPTVP
jgi:tetratricopeptide (TPR) repeat protein